jgi:hypothetical protein
MNDPDPNEPISVMRVIEFTLAVVALGLLCGAWAYSWLRGGLLAGFWYGGG